MFWTLTFHIAGYSVSIRIQKLKRRNRPTAVRIIPVEGKDVGDMVELGGLLGSAPVMPVHEAASTDFIARGGRIPAPLQSLKN